jgi:ZIP family zinc transporter
MPGRSGVLVLGNGWVVLVGGLVIGIATLASAWLARRHAARRELLLGAAAGALLVIAGLHLLPDAWSGAEQVGVSVWAVPSVAVASFVLAGAAVRHGCACRADREGAGGVATVGALTMHRLLEGVALAVTGSVTVLVALTVHSLAEGLAAGTLLRSLPPLRRVGWLAVLCAGPVAGAALTAIGPFPAGMGPVLLAVAAGVLGQTARLSLAAAYHRARLTRPTVSGVAATTLIVAIITTLAVHGIG